MSSYIAAIRDGSVNLSVASLPLTLLLAAIPHWYTIYRAEVGKVQGGWSNENPRAFVARLNAKAASGKKLSDLEELILRGQAAQQNGFEWFAVWATAVVLGYLAKIPADDMNRYTLIHLGTRVVFNYLYITTKKRSFSYARTIVFNYGVYQSVSIFFAAARALAY